MSYILGDGNFYFAEIKSINKKNAELLNSTVISIWFCQEDGSTEEQALQTVIDDFRKTYPDITVHLTLFNAVIKSGEPQKLEHNDIKWITPSEIPNYEFCPADVEILKKIIEVHL